MFLIMNWDFLYWYYPSRRYIGGAGFSLRQDTMLASIIHKLEETVMNNKDSHWQMISVLCACVFNGTHKIPRIPQSRL
jgi:hypothetical protein